jgi:hypothetical protein
MSFQENQGTAMDKYAFFNNYENLSRHIREGQSCFAIANEWYFIYISVQPQGGVTSR